MMPKSKADSQIENKDEAMGQNNIKKEKKIQWGMNFISEENRLIATSKQMTN